MNDQTAKPIPVCAGQRIAEEFGYDQVVIVARKVGVCEHVTTYGVDKAHCAVAARMGNFFKHKLMGWPAEPATDRSAQVAAVMRLVDEFSVAAGMSAIGVYEGVVRGSPDHAIIEQRFNTTRGATEAAVLKLAGEAP